MTRIAPVLRGLGCALLLALGIKVLDQIGYRDGLLDWPMAACMGLTAAPLLILRHAIDRQPLPVQVALLVPASFLLCLLAMPAARFLAATAGLVMWWSDINYDPGVGETVAWSISSSWRPLREVWYIVPVSVALSSSSILLNRKGPILTALVAATSSGLLAFIVFLVVPIVYINIQFFLVRLPLLTALVLPLLDRAVLNSCGVPPDQHK